MAVTGRHPAGFGKKHPPLAVGGGVEFPPAGPAA